jgi:hypothetical protein
MTTNNPDLHTEDLLVQPLAYWEDLLKTLTQTQRDKVKKEIATEYLRRQLRRLDDKTLVALFNLSNK